MSSEHDKDLAVAPEPIRVLCLFTVLNRGGAESMCMNIYRNIDRSLVQFDFLVYHQERGVFEDEIERLGGRVYRISHPKYLPAHIQGARRFFAEHTEYFIVHNHMQSNGAFICREAKRAGVPWVIYHSHSGPTKLLAGDIKRTARRAIGRVVNQLAYNNSNVFMACGEKAQEVLPGRYSATILRNAIDLEVFKFDAKARERVRELMRCKDKIVIGNVARFSQEKNQSFSVEVTARLKRQEIGVELWLVGDGDLREQVEQQVVEMGLEDCVRFLGVRTDISDLMQAMDVFLFPSIAEGLPVACIEAQAAGLPCLLSDGIDEHTAVTESCRFLSLSDTPDNWVDQLLELSELPREDVTEELRTAGYDIHETAAYMQEFYLEMRAVGA